MQIYPWRITVGTVLGGGAAVFAFELGLADSAVQLLGDWSSAAFKSYLEFSYLKKVSVAKNIASSFDFKVKQL